jgi:hypothetical protein
MVVAGILFWITSITMHKFIMKHPQIKDICKPFQPYRGSLQLKTPPKLMDLLAIGDFGYYAFRKEPNCL